MSGMLDGKVVLINGGTQGVGGAVTHTVAEFGRIDGLCNVAGLTTRGTDASTRRSSPPVPKCVPARWAG